MGLSVISIYQGIDQIYTFQWILGVRRGSGGGGGGGGGDDVFPPPSSEVTYLYH